MKLFMGDETIHKRLMSSGFLPQQEWMQRTLISVKENGKKYILKVSENCFSSVFQIDGCIIREGEKCDKLILCEVTPNSITLNEVFVELKGCDVSHAIKQLEATLQCPTLKHTSTRRFARIIASSYPSSKNNPMVERAKVRLRTQYQCELKCLKSNQPDTLDK